MGMTIDDCIKMLIAKEKCMKRETSGTDTNCNLHNCDDCSLCYEQGNMGEQKEALKLAIDTMRKYQKLEQEPTTKNNLGVTSGLEKNSQKLEKNFGELDCISRADAIRVASGYCHPSNVAKELAKLPSVTPQEPQTFKWCTDCKEYDQEKHCCHRWSKVIRDTVEEMKEEHIEREVLDKIRDQIIKYECDCRLSVDEYPSCKQCTDNVFETIYAILDKYKAEIEPQKSDGKERLVKK